MTKSHKTTSHDATTPNCSTCLLHQLGARQSAVVAEVCGNAALCERLGALGFRAGALVRVLQPGRPCAVEVGDSRVVLRGEHLDAIRVCAL